MGKAVKTVKLEFIENPTDYQINEKYGLYRAPRSNGRTHGGLDFLAPPNEPVRACEGGVVVKAEFKERGPGRTGSSGKVVVIDHTPV